MMTAVASIGFLRPRKHQLNRIISYEVISSLQQMSLQNVFSCPVVVGQTTTSSFHQQRSLSTTTTTTSYTDKKKAAKEYRRELYNKRMERKQRLLTRRDGSPKDVLRNQFRSWWSQRTLFENMIEHKSRKAKMDWTIKVATMIERIPVIIPDHPTWLKEYMDLKDYLSQFGKDYPKEFMPDPDEKIFLTEEELLANLPKGFKPAPRETEADHSGDVRTLNRRLKTRVYLMVEEEGKNGKPYWGFPTVWVKEDETLLDASKRALTERVGELKLYCPSNCPMAVNVSPYPEEKQKETGKFGAKTFFMRLQHDGGVVDPKALKAKDYAWLTREEIVEKIRAQNGEYQSKFYHYLL